MVVMNIEINVYLDMVFAVNFVFDLIGLYLTAIVADENKFKIKLILASCILAIGDILVIVFGFSDNVVEFLIINIFIEFASIFIAFGKKRLDKILLIMILHMGIVFLMGGMITALYNIKNNYQKGTKSMMELFVVGVLLCLILKHLMPYVLKNIYYRERIYKVIIKLKGCEICTKGLLDTGNSLLESCTGKQVTIIEKDILKEIAHIQVDKIFIIPFKSVGQNNGVLYGIQVEKLIIKHEKFEKDIKDAIIAIYNGKLSSDNRYNAILHSKCLM